MASSVQSTASLASDLTRAARTARGAWPVRLALGVVVAMALGALLAPWLAPWDPAATPDPVGLANRPPGGAHPLGTDPYSRDVLSRALHGARTSLGVGLAAAGLALLVGTAWGMTAAVLPARLRELAMGLVDVLRGVPRLVVLLAVAAVPGLDAPPAVAVLLGLTTWMATSRLVFAQVRALEGREFVAAARALGASPGRVLARHLLPHVGDTLRASGALLVADLLALEAGLSFVGLGVRPPTASWGSMVQDGLEVLGTAPWTAAVPCACLVATVLALAVLADAGAPGARAGHRGEETR